MDKFYKIAQDVTPPFIFSFIKNSILYRKSKPVLKMLFGKKLKPQWVQVENGILKGTWFNFYPNGDYQQMMLHETYDKELFDELKKMDLKGKTILDIGSHIGYHSLFFSKLVGETGSVFAFEPNPYNARKIRENLEKNLHIKNVTLNEFALSSEDSEIELVFTDKVESGTSSGSFIENSDTLYEKNSYEKGIGFDRMKVKTRKLDEMEIFKDKKIDLMKIDVEGAESLVLNGARKIIDRCKPIILIEIHSIGNMYYFMDFVRQIGYKYHLLKKENDGRHLILAKTDDK